MFYNIQVMIDARGILCQALLALSFSVSDAFLEYCMIPLLPVGFEENPAGEYYKLSA
jgi:hypothetical protein